MKLKNEHEEESRSCTTQTSQAERQRTETEHWKLKLNIFKFVRSNQTNTVLPYSNLKSCAGQNCHIETPVLNNIHQGYTFKFFISRPLITPHGLHHLAILHLLLGEQDQFLLAIWFVKIPDETIVWFAKRDNQKLTRQLVLKAPSRLELWRSNNSENREVSNRAMLDTGNFVITSTD
ncbi:g-type lectin s-receptor-like serine/threonine-protein kinase lecrk2 [Quercus suber]|uniref:G-type lectin s-receptor-like serine/threonine-protein kinase lecrk2 n=1 Tax=Quercus suber TaxID=58331 RepID=A0AAW0M3U1_QUESU